MKNTTNPEFWGMRVSMHRDSLYPRIHTDMSRTQRVFIVAVCESLCTMTQSTNGFIQISHRYNESRMVAVGVDYNSFKRVCVCVRVYMWLPATLHT